MAAIVVPRSTYDQIFDPRALGDNIKEYAFPVVKRSPAKTLDGSPWLQKGSLSPVVEYGERADVLTRRAKLSPDELSHYMSAEGIADLNQEGIELALDRRVALFFQQSILCHNVPVVLSARGADDQFGSASAIRLVSETGVTAVHKREAAHSSTNPTLLATVKDQEGREHTFVYLKGGSSHAQHNATIGMHVDVNGADELLDGKGDEGLRATSIKILNQVAGGLDPIAATKRFLGAFEEHAIGASLRLQAQDPRKAVLERYIQGIRLINQHMEVDRTVFDRLIGVNIGLDDEREAMLREVIYKRRYSMILLGEVVESRIGKRIQDAKDKMGVRERSFLEYMLLKEFSETAPRQVLEKLFAKTAAIFEREYQNSLSAKQKSDFKRFQTRVVKLQEKHAGLLADLKRDLRADFRELSSSEFAFRSQVFKDLRTRVRDWTQRQFCQKYHESTGKRVSQAWVSRMEQPTRINTKNVYRTPLNQRMRAVTLEDARDCAQTFGIDIGLFLPCLITSR